jgi:hypothetical protein
VFQQGVKEGFIIQNEIARLLVREQLDEAIRGAGFAAQHCENKINVRGRELDPTVGLNHFHRFFFKKSNVKNLPAHPFGFLKPY